LEQPVSARSASATGAASVVGFLVVLEFASGVLQAWLPPLLPSVLRQYGTSAAELNWINVVFLLSTAVCVPLMATLGDRYGHRRLLVVASSLVASGSVVVAVAPTFEILLLGRAVQGPLGAFLPLVFAIIRERAGERTGRAIGLVIGAVAVGGGLGFLLAGTAREHLSLSLTLWIPAAVMICAVPVVVLLVPETTARTTGRIDWAGAALLSAGLVLFLAAVGNGSTWGWTDGRTVAGIVGGVALLAAWVVVEGRVAHPLLDLSLVFGGTLTLPILAGFFYGAELYGSQVAVALFLGLPISTGFGLGLSSGQLGLVLFVFAASAFAGTVLAPRVAERFGSSIALLTGALLAATGYLLTVAAHGSAGVFVLWQVVIGLGNGVVLATLSTQVVTRAPADSVAISSGLFTTARTVGGALSGAAFAAVMAALTTSAPGAGKPVTSEAGYVTVWVVCAALALTVAGLALRQHQARPPTAGPQGGGPATGLAPAEGPQGGGPATGLAPAEARRRARPLSPSRRSGAG
jgi:MFS family permease